MSRPTGCAFSENGKLFVADSNHARVLIWNNPNTLANGQTAESFWGQPDFLTSGFSGKYSATQLAVRGVYISNDSQFKDILFINSNIDTPSLNDLAASRILMVPVP